MFVAGDAGVVRFVVTSGGLSVGVLFKRLGRLLLLFTSINSGVTGTSTVACPGLTGDCVKGATVGGRTAVSFVGSERFMLGLFVVFKGDLVRDGGGGEAGCD